MNDTGLIRSLSRLVRAQKLEIKNLADKVEILMGSCEHLITNPFATKDWNFCPICGKRPAPISKSAS